MVWRVPLSPAERCGSSTRPPLRYRLSMATEANQNASNENGAEGATPAPKGKKMLLIMLGVGAIAGGASGTVIGGPMLAKHRAAAMAAETAAGGEHGNENG